MELRSLITLSAAQSLTLRKAARMRFKAGFCKRVANRDIGCRVVLAWKFERNLVRKLVRKFARKFARKFGHEHFGTKRFGKFPPQKNSPQFAAVFGDPFGERAPQTEIGGCWGSVNLDVLWGGSEPQCLRMPASLLVFSALTCGAWWTFRIFFIFSLSGGGGKGGGVRGGGRGVGFN